MSNKVDQRVVDLGYDIIRDSKRRTLYYDEKTKKGYQIQQSDIKWIRLYKLRFFIALVVYFGLFMLLRAQPIVNRIVITFLAGFIAYVLITIFFERVFLKDKIPFKINQKDFDQRYELDVLKQKRTLQRFHLAFVLIYGLLAVLELYAVNTNLWITIIITASVIAMIVFFIQKLLTLREQIKIAQKGAN